MNYPTPDPTTTRGILLASYTWGQDALQWGAMDEETRLEEALDDVARIHPRIREEYEGGATHAWYGDRWARGAFAMFAPEQQTQLQADIVRPEGQDPLRLAQEALQEPAQLVVGRAFRELDVLVGDQGDPLCQRTVDEQCRNECPVMTVAGLIGDPRIGERDDRPAVAEAEDRVGSRQGVQVALNLVRPDLQAHREPLRPSASLRVAARLSDRHREDLVAGDDDVQRLHGMAVFEALEHDIDELDLVVGVEEVRDAITVEGDSPRARQSPAYTVRSTRRGATVVGSGPLGRGGSCPRSNTSRSRGGRCARSGIVARG